jgi:NAD(P)-dependent dehydrogenase (short-subunit alcohol dehydrogenase family)
VRDTVTELQQEVEEKHRNLLMAADSEAMVCKIIKAKRRGKKVVGIACDVAKSDEVQALADFAVKKLGKIDIWVSCNIHESFAYAFWWLGQPVGATP